jgi:PIN domain nuclease of toxin-antitoxin system
MPTPDRLLLDTHVWIWLMDGAAGKLTTEIRSRIQAAAGKGQVYVSAISVWEVATLEARGKITLSMDCRTWVDRALGAPGVKFAELTAAIAVDSTRLPDGLHGDPADRILVATARALHGTLVTRDRLVLEYSRKGHVHTVSTEM